MLAKIGKPCYISLKVNNHKGGPAGPVCEGSMEGSVEVLLHGTQFKHLLSSRMEGLRERYGLRKIDVEILYYLHRCGDRDTSTDIREKYQFTKGHISQSVERLQEMHLLEGVPDQQDRRCVHFRLTDEADGLVSHISDMWDEMTAIFFEGVTEEEKCVLRRVAGKIARNMELATDRHSE